MQQKSKSNTRFQIYVTTATQMLNIYLPYIKQHFRGSIFFSAKVYMNTAFEICITDIYFPHIEDKMLSNVRNLRYHDINTIKLS